MSRFFGRRIRNALYLAAGGCCVDCGRVLGPGWEADHRLPRSRGGPTTFHNGAATCPPCNRAKGATQVSDITLRPIQRRLIETTLNRIATGDRSLVGNIHPATGKTAGALLAADELFRRGLIDAVQVFVPRLNLATQFELDWRDLRERLQPGAMGILPRRENTPPLLRGDAAGYVATYSALAAAQDSVVGNIHVAFARGRRTLAILDEGQLLGVGDLGGGTRAAGIAAAVADAARFTILLTGTPYRADNLPLLLARYGDPDESGRRRLLADVEAGYREGVALGYLRPFEFTLVDGAGLRESVDGARSRLVVSETSNGLRRLLEHPGYWAGLVDRTVAQIRRVQEIDPRHCGLIAASSQQHAQAIQAYLGRAHPGVRALLAVSDDARANENLQRFKSGGQDVLITVQMAHIGYDHKPITVVCVLTDIRAPGYLRQLVSRGLRMLTDRPVDRQMLYTVVPDDPAMADFVRIMRDESLEGLRERQAAVGGEPPPPLQAASVIVQAEVLGQRAAGLTPEGDLDREEYAIIERAQRAYGLGAASRTGLGALLRASGVEIRSMGVPEPAGPAAGPVPVGGPVLTERERERALRRQLQEEAVACDTIARRLDPDWAWGSSQRECKRLHGGIPAEACGAAELEARVVWMRATWRPQVAREAASRARSR